MGSRSRKLNPRKKPSQSRSRFTVDQILEAAAQVFAAKGYAGGTTNHIARRAGVSVGSLYQYFPNKEAILVALVEQHMTAASRSLQAMMDQALEEGWDLDVMIERFVRVTVALHTAAPKLHHVLIYDAPRPPSVVSLIHDLENTMAKGVETVLTERLGVHVRHARHAAYILVHVVDALAHEFVLHPPDDMDEEIFVAEVVTLIGAYLVQPCPETDSRPLK